MKGIGKFHWIRQTLPDALHVDMEDAKISSRLIPKPELLSHLIQSMRPGQWVVVHELQRVPELLTYVYPQIAEHGLRFALLSSNIHRLQVERAQDLVSGQINRLNMHPLTPAELGYPWSIEEVLRYGTIAPVWGAEDRQGMLNHVNSSAQLHLREEIRYRITMKVLHGFVQFVPIAARLHAQPLNTGDIAQNYGLTASNVELYLKILEDAMVITRLAAFNPKKRASLQEGRSKSAKKKHADSKRGRKRKPRKPKRLSRHERRYRPKLYWTDPGLVRAVGNKVGPVVGDERRDLLEGWVLSTLQAHNDYQNLYDEIAYWPSAKPLVKVEFLLTRGREHLAVAVEDVGEYSTEAFKGLRSIARLSGLTRRVAVYTGSETIATEDGIDVWPMATFGAALASDSLWP